MRPGDAVGIVNLRTVTRSVTQCSAAYRTAGLHGDPSTVRVDLSRYANIDCWCIDACALLFISPSVVLRYNIHA